MEATKDLPITMLLNAATDAIKEAQDKTKEIIFAGK